MFSFKEPVSGRKDFVKLGQNMRQGKCSFMLKGNRKKVLLNTESDIKHRVWSGKSTKLVLQVAQERTVQCKIRFTSISAKFIIYIIVGLNKSLVEAKLYTQ
jgi:hypothetical protein